MARTSVMRALLMVASFLVLTFAPVGCGEETGATVALLRLDRLLAKASGHTHGDEHTLADELPGNIDYPVSMASSADGTGSVTTLTSTTATGTSATRSVLSRTRDPTRISDHARNLRSVPSKMVTGTGARGASG